MNKTLLILVSHLSFFISHRLELAISAKNLGYNVKVAFGELDTDISYLTKNGIENFHVPIQRGGTNIFRDFKSLYFIWSLFRKVRPDIVHLVSIKPYLYGGIIARLSRVPCVVSAVSGLGSLFIHEDFISRFLRLLIYPFYQIAFNHPNQKVIVQNQEDANLLVKWGVLNLKKVTLIRGSGVKIENFTNLKEKDKIPTVCFASRLILDKGVYDYVSAARLIQKRGVKAKFFLAGEIDNRNPTALKKNDLIDLKKDKNIEFIGYQKNIPLLYSNCHIVCLPSYREGLPKALLEAAAASRAVVTTDVPGCRDAIISNKTGLLVPIKNPVMLANSLQWLIENPIERVQMGKAGRELAEKEFRIEIIIKKHLNTYKELLSDFDKKKTN